MQLVSIGGGCLSHRLHRCRSRGAPQHDPPTEGMQLDRRCTACKAAGARHRGAPVRKKDATLEKGVGGAPRQPLYPRNQWLINRLAPKLQEGT